MKIISFIFFCIITLFLKISFADDDTLLFTGHQHPPWHFESEDGELIGINIDLSKTICKRLKLKCKFEYMPWVRSWQSMKDGKTQAIMSASRKKARQDYLYYPEEDIRISEYVFFVHKDNYNKLINGSYEEVSNHKLKVGIQNGASYDKTFWKNFPYLNGSFEYDPDARNYNKQLHPVSMPEQNFRKLASKRIDVFLFDRDVGLYQLKKLGLEDTITHYSVVLFSKGYPISFSKTSNFPNLEKIEKQFEQELIKLKKESTYRKIIDKWLE